MIRNGKILVPTDFSEQSAEVIRRACVLASQFGAKVHLLHVITASTNFEADMISSFQLEELHRAQLTSATNRLAEQAASIDLPVVTHLEDAVADPAQAICEFAKNLNTDLIVIGRHSREGVLEHMLLGSTAERIIRYAPCSVFVVMPHGILEKLQ